MAGHIPRRVLQKPEVHKCLLGGTVLFKSDENDAIQKLTFYADKDAYFLWAKGTDTNKTHENLIWDIQLISDVRSGKPPKESKSLQPLLKDDGNDELYLTLVYTANGIADVEYVHLLAQSPEVADTFKKAVNALTFNMLHAHAAPRSFLKKHYLKIKLHANGKGEIPLKSINKLMMIKYVPNSFINQWLAQFRIVKDSDDGKNKFILVEDFTEDLFFKMVDQILNNRTNAIDVVFSSLVTKSKKTPQLTLKEFHTFLNSQQRDPRLNEILYPFVSRDNASKIIAKYENGKSDRLSSKGMMEYLMSEENNVLDLEHLNQTHDMSQPLNHYFINSSHNTYLTGHQLRSNSTAEMYIQCLLMGCRCVELDCWPENDSIIITHGGTFCGKVAFEEVVAAIAEFAFVTSEYPLILSIENHCRRHPHLMQHMANTFRTFFGDKLLSQPLDESPLEPGVPLPPPEKLKNKILIKDKLMRKKGENMGTLQRGASLNMEPILEKPSREEENSEAKADPISSEPESEDSSLKQRNSQVSPSPSGEQQTSTSPSGEQQGSASPSGEQQGSVSPTEEETKSSDGKEGSNGEKTSDGNTSPSQDKGGSEGELFPVQRTYGPDGPDITTINVALIHQRPSEEGISTGPLAEILNYTTGITFEGFAAAEKTNCHFHMSSFVEEKGLNHIRNKPKDFVKYNMRQLSRIYPQGARINSSNYMPIIYWSVGSQMVALNFQTPDVPVQINTAKFQFNGNTGYMFKPWVMNREGAARGVFNPFVQSKLEDIVPAKLKVKVIAGYFLTPAEKTTNCYVEVDLYGLPADTVKHKYWTKRVPGPHPFWNEDYFVFKRVLLPEMALLRIAVLDENKELIGQRVMPLNAIRPGFRHINLRDKHNAPLPLELLLVQIQVEDWVPDEMEDLVAMLMDPISFANRALQEMAEGLDASEKEFSKIQGLDTDETDAPKQETKTKKPSIPTTPKEAAAVSLLPPQIGSLSGTSYNSSSLTRKPPANPSQLHNLFAEDSLPCLEAAKARPEPVAIQQDSKEVVGHPEFKKLDKKHSQTRSSMLKKHEKTLKSLKEKVSKGKGDEGDVAVLEVAQKTEIINFNKTCSSERYEKKRLIIEAAHKFQMKDLRERIHKNDRAAVTKELAAMMKKKRSETDMKENKKQSLQEIEDRAVSIGKKCRSEFDRLHSIESNKLEERQRAAIQELVKTQAKELDDLNTELSTLDATPM